MISDIETTDIKASVTASHVIRSLLNAVFSGDEDDMQSSQDKKLLEDVLLYGTMAKVAKRNGSNPQTVSIQLDGALSRFNKKISTLKKILKKEAKTQLALNKKKKEITQIKREVAQTRKELAKVQKELVRKDEEMDLLRQVKRKIVQDADILKTQYESANQTIADLKKKIEKEKSINTTNRKKLQTQSSREEKLKQKIYSLENLVEWYKNKNVPMSWKQEIFETFEI